MRRFLRLPLILTLAALGTLPVVRAVQSSSEHLLPGAPVSPALAALALTQLLVGGLVLTACAERRRRSAEADLVQREAQVGAILDAAGEAFLVVDRDSRIIRWNRQAEATFGWSAEEALGRNPVELTIPEGSAPTTRRISPGRSPAARCPRRAATCRSRPSATTARSSPPR
ncbi:PAS domain S-box protein [Planomonospora algeriensis]